MKQPFRILLGLWLASVISACGLPLPVIPPGWTVTPSPLPPLAASPVPSATATPVPVVRVQAGDHAFFNGDYETALAHYQTAYRDSSDPSVRSAARWGEARVQYADGRLQDALTALQSLISEFPDSVHLADAHFLQAQIFYETERYLEAASAWQTYLTLRPGILDAYVQEMRGDALYEAETYGEALSAYTAAIQAPRLDDAILVDLKAAQTHVKLGDYTSALAVYDGITARTVNDFIKAQAVYLSGQAYQAQGQNEQAFSRFRLAVENYPLSYYSYLSLIELVNAGIPVSDLDRGLVDYYAAQYDVALAAFDRYIADNPTNDGTAHYYRALTLWELGNHQAAVDGLSVFITNYSPHPMWPQAWDDKATLQWQYLGFNDQAAQTLFDFVALFPDSSLSPDYLMYAARILERDNRLDEAALAWERVANEYPGNAQASTGMFLAGIVRYRQGNFTGALDTFSRSLSFAITPEERARAFLWTGKAQQQLGDASAAQTAWQQAQSIDPGSYYSERARDLQTGRAPFDAPAVSNLSVDLAAERAGADAWMRLTFNLPADMDLTGPGALAQDPRFIRGNEFWKLGLFDEARLEFENLRQAVVTNAVDSYRLGNYLLDLGMYRPAIFAIRETLTLAGMDDQIESLLAPPYFSHVRYGLYYSELIIPDAQLEGFDPLFVFSVVRQESLFEGFVRSTAGARGLMQVIPGTGADIANQLNWPFEYTHDDLYRPDVSIRFGSHYLATNRALLGGDMSAMLAAYNGGPGNALAWQHLANGDPDLFLEVVRFEETRNYIRSIYEFYVIYRRLYAPAT
jgi:soluble lytic murein transglycosylase